MKPSDEPIDSSADLGADLPADLGRAILFLSDTSSGSYRSEASAIVVADRERAAAKLDCGGFSAICLDRSDVGQALSDANWLRQRRNALPVLAVVDANQVSDATRLLGVGVGEILVRGQQVAQEVAARLQLISLRGLEGPRAAATEGLTLRSAAMRKTLESVARAQRSQASVLLQGETGTGKEVFARVIHRGGKRQRGPFVAVNCAAFPETLLESELFGFERGAFTGANRAKRGLFVEANEGTLFLDEIGETSLGFQVKLLRALQEGVIRPLGSTRETRVDVRVVAATNRNLEEEVEALRFRRDLFYRVNVLGIHLPPLRSRLQDIVPLAESFLKRHEGAPASVAPDAARLLEAYAWPGNVRELENEVARVAALASGEREVTARMLSTPIQGLQDVLPRDSGSDSLRATVARFEAWFLRQSLARHDGRRIATARSLGITRECLYKKLKRYGMQ